MRTIREIEHDSIRAYLIKHAKHFAGGRVLDLGCGRQPYRDIVERVGGEYFPYDLATHPGSLVEEDVVPDDLRGRDFDAVMCTQVIQFAEDPAHFCRTIRMLLRDDGILVMTGPSAWPEVDVSELWRITRSGVRHLLRESGFALLDLTDRATVQVLDAQFSLGWGAVARAAA